MSRNNIDMNINCTFYLQKSQHCTFNVINVFIRSSYRGHQNESYLQDFAEFTSHNFVDHSKSYKSYQHCVSLNLLHFCCLWATIQNYDVGLAHIWADEVIFSNLNFYRHFVQIASWGCKMDAFALSSTSSNT